MLKPQGYAVMTSPDGKKESDTFQCGHCQRIVHVPPRADPALCGGFCRCCMQLICGPCVDKPCDHYMKKIERWEARDRLRRSILGS